MKKSNKKIQVILLRKIHPLGSIGSVIQVKKGYARNWLIPTSKAVVATQEALDMKGALEAKAIADTNKMVSDATELAKKLEGKTISINCKADAKGHLYSSITSKKIAPLVASITDSNLTYKNIVMPLPIKTIGTHDVRVDLLSDISCKIQVVAVKRG